MIISKSNLEEIRAVYGYLNLSEESFSNHLIVFMSTAYYETHFKPKGEEFSKPLKDTLCMLISRTEKIDFEPVYADFNDESFMINFVEYCLKKDYKTALQNLLFYCQRRIENFEYIFQQYIFESFGTKRQ